MKIHKENPSKIRIFGERDFWVNGIIGAISLSSIVPFYLDVLININTLPKNITEDNIIQTVFEIICSNIDFNNFSINVDGLNSVLQINNNAENDDLNMDGWSIN